MGVRSRGLRCCQRGQKPQEGLAQGGGPDVGQCPPPDVAATRGRELVGRPGGPR